MYVNFQAYNSKTKSFEEPPTKARMMGSKGKVSDVLHPINFI
jgi:hypothetical protein